jgi:putative glutamine amidotransferase
MKRPVIGLTSRSTNGPTCLTGVSRAYLAALESAGAAPLILPLGLGEASWRALFERLDGVLIPGGGDIGLQRLGIEGPAPLKETSQERDLLEFTMVRWAVDEGRPLLGICRGAQVMTVALGGTLYLDLRSQFPGALTHDLPQGTPRHLPAHGLVVEPGSRLGQALGARELAVNSFHHQAPREIPPGARITARAPDGVVEGLELPGHPFALGVQWHPEEMQSEPAMRALFEAFVAACARQITARL